MQCCVVLCGVVSCRVMSCHAVQCSMVQTLFCKIACLGNLYFICYFYFGGMNATQSMITLQTALRDHSHCWELNPGQQHARRVPYLLCSSPMLENFCFYILLPSSCKFPIAHKLLCTKELSTGYIGETDCAIPFFQCAAWFYIDS